MREVTFLVDYKDKEYNVIFDGLLVEIHELARQGIKVVEDSKLISKLLEIVQEKHDYP